MSSYLNFYLKPKENKKRYTEEGEVEVKLTQEPLLLLSYSRNTDVYQSFDENLNIAYAGNEDKYTELTVKDCDEVINDVKNDIEKTERRLEISYKIAKQNINDDLFSDIHSMEEYLDDLKRNLNELNQITNIVSEIENGYTDFEKVMINIG